MLAWDDASDNAKFPASGERASVVPRLAFNRLDHQLTRFSCVAPAQNLDPLVGFQNSVMLEEVLDPLQRDSGQVGVVLYIHVTLCEVSRGYGQNFLVLTTVVFHDQYTNGTSMMSFGGLLPMAIASMRNTLLRRRIHWRCACFSSDAAPTTRNLWRRTRPGVRICA